MPCLERIGRVRDIDHRRTILQADEGVFPLGVEVEEPPDIVGGRRFQRKVAERHMREKVDPGTGEIPGPAALAGHRTAARVHGSLASPEAFQLASLVRAQPLEVRHDMEPLVTQLAAKFPGYTGQRRLVPARRLVGEVVETVETALELDDAAGQAEDFLDGTHRVAAGGNEHPIALGRDGSRVLDGSTGAHGQRAVASIPAMHRDMAGNLVFTMPQGQAATEQQGREENHPARMPANI